MCVKKVLNIGQLSYGIFENYEVKETIYNLKQWNQVWKKGEFRNALECIQVKKFIYIYIYPNLLGIFFSLELVIHFKFFDISKKFRWKMYICKNKRFYIENYF